MCSRRKRLRDVIFLAWCDWTLLIILSRCTFQKKGGLAEKSGFAEKSLHLFRLNLSVIFGSTVLTALAVADDRRCVVWQNT